MRFSLIALSIATLGLLPPGGTFIDDDGTTHEGSIEAVAAAGITKGCNPPDNDRYCPDEPVTRGEMAAFLTRALDLAGTERDHFTDDDGHTFESDIDSLALAGITRGCGTGVFCPDRAMTRGEMAAMLTRAIDYEPSPADHFVDDDQHPFEESIDMLAQAEVTRGCNPPDNDRFCPDEPISRGEMATFLMRALGLEPIDPPERPQPVVAVTARESWGAVPAKTDLMEPHDPVRMTVHHAGTQTGTTGPAQFRGWQSWHMSGQGWGDIAYHVIIGIDGTVYEGRDLLYEGDSATSYDTTGHFLVVVEGYFDEERPTAAQVDSVERVLAWASEEFQMSPTTISGHRDHAATTCPGEHLHALIESGELRKGVQSLIDSGGIELDWP